ncbi:unnamed protein product, partial [Oppiella nova]
INQAIVLLIVNAITRFRGQGCTLKKTNLTVTTMGHCVKDTSVQVIKDFLSLFYIMSPYETSYDNAIDVPDYEVNSVIGLTPVVGFLVILEQVIRYFQRQDLTRFQDYVINAGSAILFTLMRI